MSVYNKTEGNVQTDETAASTDIQTRLSEQLTTVPSLTEKSAVSSRISVGIDNIDDYYKPIKFINIIFLPHHPTFKMFVLAAVIIKSASLSLRRSKISSKTAVLFTVITCELIQVAVCGRGQRFLAGLQGVEILYLEFKYLGWDGLKYKGPLRAVYPFDTCEKLPQYKILQYIASVTKLSDFIYIIDIILHMVHRQVVDEATKREHLPKSMGLLFLDILSVIPMRDLATKSTCPDTVVWPNILSFNEVLIIYRVIDFFYLQNTHSIVQLLAGYGLFLSLLINAASCFILLVTFNGLCGGCRTQVYDWRALLLDKYPNITNASEGYNAYILSTSLATMFLANKVFDDMDPKTLLGIINCIIFAFMTYWLNNLVCLPKTFAECILRAQKKAIFHLRAKRIVEEINRRNTSHQAYINVDKFYDLSWKVHKGITCLPEVINMLPRFLLNDVQQDLFWTIFHHSPALRDTSREYKRWLGEKLKLEYKLPGERFFSGVHCYTNVYYIKSGVVQFISTDDNTSPLLSVSGGTLIGDISFFLPPLKRKVSVHCLTYCEILILSRGSIIEANHRFPADRWWVMKHAEDRIKHARNLHACKQEKRNNDRSEVEGIAWLKKQWWEVANAVAKIQENKQEASKYLISSEKMHSHCPKFIGQLVLCSENQLQSQSIFAKYTFPWIIFPNSSFNNAWHRIMQVTVAVVVVLYPPNLTRYKIATWFKFLHFFVDLIYIGDILLLLVTALDRKQTNKFTSVVIARCKTQQFVLDVISSPFINNFVDSKRIMLNRIFTFNRLIKIHIFFTRNTASESWKNDPLSSTLHTLLCTQFTCVYVCSYFLFILLRFLPSMSTIFFFGTNICSYHESKDCRLKPYKVLNVLEGFITQVLFVSSRPTSYTDLGIGVIISFLGFIIMVFLRSKFLAELYLKYKQIVRYHKFVSTLKMHMINYEIHPDLLRRLMQYLEVHFKYYEGVDVLKPIVLINEPREVYYKYHGAVAEKIISDSKIFHNASYQLIRDLAQAATFILLPAATPLYLFGSKCRNITWIVNGTAKCEYPDDSGRLVKTFTNHAEMLVPCAVFLGRASLRTFVTETDCEILSINIRDFYKTLKRYKDDFKLFETGIKELEPTFVRLFQAFVRKHQDYQKKLDTRLCHEHRKTVIVLPENKQNLLYSDATYIFKADVTLFGSPENRFVKVWMCIRTMFVCISILNRAMRGGAGVYFMKVLNLIESICSTVTLFDICFKLFLPYYAENGVLITSYSKCLLHYLSRGFLADVIGGLPVGEMLQSITALELSAVHIKTIDTITCYFHVYLVTGFFEYLCSKPTPYFVFLSIIKWQIVIVMLCFTMSNMFLNKCVVFVWNSKNEIVNFTKSDSCWVPAFFNFKTRLHREDLQFLCTQALYLAQCAAFKTHISNLKFDKSMHFLLDIFIIIGVIFWYINCYAQSLLLLQMRGENMFQNSLQKLVRFLREERVEKPIIERTLHHFLYWWDRTSGIDTTAIMNGRMGIVFRQDVNFYLFRKTLVALDTILRGGEILQRQLSNNVTQTYYLEKEDVVREMHITGTMHIVHRGRVAVTKNGETLAVLTKGAIIGQLDNAHVRPITITATTLEPTDILEIPIIIFHEIITQEIHQTIENNPDYENDFLNLKKPVSENPFNSIPYLLKGTKAIKLPRMLAPVTATQNDWYCRYLYVMYLWSTSLSIFLTPIYVLTKDTAVVLITTLLLLMDFIHMIYVISEFFTMELAINNNKCVYVYYKWRILAHPRFFFDAISIVLPILDFFSSYLQPDFQLFRMLRIYMFYEFYQHFTKNFKNKYSSILLKFVIIFLVLHLLTCFWMRVACQHFQGGLVNTARLPPNATVYRGEWSSLKERPHTGCPRIASKVIAATTKKLHLIFVKPKTWVADYILALCFVVFMQTHTQFLSMAAFSTKQMWTKILILEVLSLLELWIISMSITWVYTKYRDLLYYDFTVRNLIVYLKKNGLAPSLVGSVTKYFQMLWVRNEGTWLPAMVHTAPVCLRQDLFSSLYMHHLKYSKVFGELPDYFLLQLVVRMKRIVIFPGNTIVQEGESNSTTYFIHEGEVEQWATDAYGDGRLLMLMLQNQSFGNGPGILGVTYMFTFKTRTVTDLVYLCRADWKDLLAAYPNVKRDIEQKATFYFGNLKKALHAQQDFEKAD